jgi:heptosyltransferase-2
MRILIVTLLNIGDVLFTTPAMRSVRAAYPDAEIDVLVKKLAVDTVAHSPIFTNVFSFDTKAEGKSPSAMLKLLRRIRARRYDLLVSLHAAARVTLITAFSGAKRKVGLVSRKFEWVMDQPAIQKTGMHMVGSYLEVLRDVGITPIEDAPMEMFVGSESQAAADEMWRSADLAVQEVIGLNPGSRAAKKTWPATNWASLADLVNRSGSRAIIFGGHIDLAGNCVGNENRIALIRRPPLAASACGNG